MRYRRKRRYRRSRRFGWKDAFVTLLFLGALFGIVTLLDGHDPKSFSGRVQVADGDSIVMNGERLRLTGIDAPEMSQECSKSSKLWMCGRASRDALRGFLRGKQLSCKTTGLDRYDRWLAVCVADGQEVNKWMVESGWAVDYGGYGREEGSARRAGKGLWGGEFENPQEWRHANRGEAVEVPVSFKSRLNDWFEKASTWTRNISK